MAVFSEYERIYSLLPSGFEREVKRISAARRGGFSELHFCVGGRSSLLFMRERVYLTSSVSAEDMRSVVLKLCGGALYAHRDTITDGYVCMDGGVRVGVCGQARYEGGRLVGVSDISSLVFRIPVSDSSLTDELCRAWGQTSVGMLIYAPPGGGKTTALRSLTARLAEEDREVRIAVVDERCEFSPEECSRHGIDLFRGYKRADGMGIALRTMSPDIIAIDEIGAGSESEEMLDSLNSGIKLIATAHASSLEELLKRKSIRPLVERDVFDTFFGIFRAEGDYRCSVEKLQCSNL